MSFSITSFLQASVVKEAWGQARKQVPFIASLTLNLTALEAQRQVRAGLSSRFTIRNHRVGQGIRVVNSTKRNLTASIGSVDTFMPRHELGATWRSRSGKSLAIPDFRSGVLRRGASGSIPAALKPGRLLERGVDPRPGRAPVGASAGKERAFVMEFADGRHAEVVVHRGRVRGKRAIHGIGPSGKRLRTGAKKIPSVARREFRFAYTFRRSVVIRQRWGLQPQVAEVAGKMFPEIFRDSARYIWQREGIGLRP